MAVRHWGVHFPDVTQADVKHWDVHFPDVDGVDGVTVPGFGPAGSGLLALDFDQAFTLTMAWATDIITRKDGTEQRIADLDRPKQFYSGAAILLGDDVRSARTRMARFAAAGNTFLLGLPHEELPLVRAASGKTVYVPAGSVALSDWARPGQRVVVVAPDGESVAAVLQSASDGQIELDVTPGNVGRVGGAIMPTMAILLNPQQAFPRYPVDAANTVERWSLQARAAIFDFAPDLAYVDLPIGGRLQSRIFGLIGNTFTFEASGTFISDFAESTTATEVKIYEAETTLGDLAELLAASSHMVLTGSYDPDTLLDPINLILYPLAGGARSGLMGTGVELVTYAGRPVWDRPLLVQDVAGDNVNSLVTNLDLGGLPYAIGHADNPVWGRDVRLKSASRIDWQWFKLFQATVFGRQRAWWLPTWRNDLTPVSWDGVSELVVRGDDGGDPMLWFPQHRDRLQIIDDAGNIAYARIATAEQLHGVDEGKVSLELDALDGDTLTGSIVLVSWLELCRFESDEFVTEWIGGVFTFNGLGRVVRA